MFLFTVFNISQRAKLISSLEFVDYVIINNSKTAENLIKILRPNVYSKGIDYLNYKKDYTNNIKKEINSLKSVNGKIKFTKSQKIDSSKILNQFDLIFSDEQKKFIKNIQKKLNLNIFDNYLEKIKNLKILVIGELIIDEYVICDPLGKSGKEAFLTFKKKDGFKFIGGSGFIANQTANFSKNVEIITTLGTSNRDKQFVYKKINKKVKIKPFFRNDSKTINKLRYIDQIDLKKIIGIYELNNNLIKKPLEKNQLKTQKTTPSSAFYVSK